MSFRIQTGFFTGSEVRARVYEYQRKQWFLFGPMVTRYGIVVEMKFVNWRDLAERKGFHTKEEATAFANDKLKKLEAYYSEKGEVIE